ncbi:NAD(P)-dependent oxidoreductase [Enterococcus gilvus]|uniref:2-hydroxy-3-oxopropionate reductase n=1 Tax=Enterococcus gilvus ATCC BAA-350 TaxID=1158614 RepID=R2XLK5_9ENTE|nr:NAD(P)-dependent oxidoreductase [Enterococcus gilvus]EOI55423.1 hypothetical protein UKC_02631 [Enterococcus gilvus ATCC BAA-350]EOW82034.1 hypothetical protein I592_01335 [Enterococcus gilvus ATCC BAA-350]OJG43063.1 hypothetical protein RV02_GL002983 [Enterococcus gilvus]
MKLGFVGLGIMGESMALNLVKKSNTEVYVFDFVKEKVQELVAEGAIAASSGKEVAENADIVFTSVPKATHVKAVHEEIYPVVKEGQIFVDMSTIAPKDSIALGEEMSKRRAYFLDSPVVKSKQAAIDGTLGIYVGGPKEQFEVIKPFLEMIGSAVVYMGTNGKGLVMKICHNMLVGEIQNGVNEMMVLANQNGINWEDFSAAIDIGGGKNFYLETKGKAIGTQDFTTAFSVENMYKDVNIAGEMISEQGLDLPGTKLVQAVYQSAMDKDFGGEDFSATFKIVSDQ